MTATHPPAVDVAVVRRAVEEIARDVLERGVDPAVDLFDQGATSLAFLRIVAALDERFGIAVEVAELEEASVEALAELVARQSAGTGPDTTRPTGRNRR